MFKIYISKRMKWTAIKWSNRSDPTSDCILTENNNGEFLLKKKANWLLLIGLKFQTLNIKTKWQRPFNFKNRFIVHNDGCSNSQYNARNQWKVKRKQNKNRQWIAQKRKTNQYDSSRKNTNFVRLGVTQKKFFFNFFMKFWMDLFVFFPFSERVWFSFSHTTFVDFVITNKRLLCACIQRRQLISINGEPEKQNKSLK